MFGTAGWGASAVERNSIDVEAHTAVVHRYIEDGTDQHDFTVIDEVLTTGADACAGHRRARTSNWMASPDWHYPIEKMSAEGNTVVVRVTAGGTHQHDWKTPLGTAPATGKRITTSWMAIFWATDVQQSVQQNVVVCSKAQRYS